MIPIVTATVKSPDPSLVFECPLAFMAQTGDGLCLRSGSHPYALLILSPLRP